ncbi:MAG: glutathione S-transferase family protein [Parasphingorhabdus sp.]
MTMTVYAVSGAPRPWRVLAGLTFKELEFDIRYLEASKGEHKSPEYLKINPRGTVPSLTYGNLTLRDSIGILAWLDREFPEKPLFGNDASEAAEIWQNVLEMADYLRSAHNSVFFSILVQGISVTNESSAERKAMEEAAEKLKMECENLEEKLENNNFLCGDRPTAADAVAFPDIRLIQRAAEIKADDLAALGIDTLLTRDFPKLKAWKTRVEDLPGMSKTMPPHWNAQ